MSEPVKIYQGPDWYSAYLMIRNYFYADISVPEILSRVASCFPFWPYKFCVEIEFWCVMFYGESFSD